MESTVMMILQRFDFCIIVQFVILRHKKIKSSIERLKGLD